MIKLDVEGADLHALRGMAGTLKRLGPSLLIERHDIYGYYELADLTGLLEELGLCVGALRHLPAEREPGPVSDRRTNGRERVSDDQRIMHQVVDATYGPDGLTVLYGPGELHDPGTLPEGVGFRAVVADDVARAVAPAWAQPAPAPAPAPEPAPAKEETAAPPATVSASATGSGGTKTTGPGRK